jgi:hypothetical protein
MTQNDALVGGIEQEDEGNDRVGSPFASGVCVDGGASSLEGEEDYHTDARTDEQYSAADPLTEERGSESPSQVPNLKDTVDEQLNGSVSNANSVEDSVEVVRDETIARPLGEESDSDDDAHAPTVATGSEEGLPANLSSDFTIEVNGGLDFFVLVLDQRIFGVAIGVIVGEGLQSLLMATLADEPTRRLGAEPDEGDLDDGGETLDSRRDAPRPGVVNLEGTERRPCSTIELLKQVQTKEKGAGLHNGTRVPKGIVGRRKGGTVRGIGNLGDQQRGGACSKSQTKADQETADTNEPRMRREIAKQNTERQ